MTVKMELCIPAATVYIFTDLFNDADRSVGRVCVWTMIYTRPLNMASIQVPWVARSQVVIVLDSGAEGPGSNRSREAVG